MSRYRSEIIICLFLIMTTLAVYWQVGNHEFVNYDDDDYVTENRQVRAGCTIEGVTWAFTTKFHGHWHPLTWLSHMTDCQLFGLNPGRHHLTSLFLHIANTLLLFLVFKRMTGALLRSAFVAALFALHPLHVETVAWVADRKDVLSTFFWMLTMWTYVRYSKRPGFNRYLPVLIAFVLGLMAKSMVVTLPFVLLLMDYWPLGRYSTIQQFNNSTIQQFNHSSLPRLVWEKVLFLILMGACAVVTVSVMQYERTPDMDLSKLWPTKSHIANALVSYITYIGKMLWPLDMAIPYPCPDVLPVWQVGGAGLLLLCISFLVFWRRRRYPYLLVGWLWYLVTLVPVIGLVKGGPHAIADRYTYVPLIGLFIIIAWGVPDILARWRYKKKGLAAASAILLSILMVITWFQLRHWTNGITLFKHAINVTANNSLAHNNLGNALKNQGKLSEAIKHYIEALRIRPNYVLAHYNLGNVLTDQGKLSEAIKHYTDALRIRPNYAKAHNNLGNALKNQGKLSEAIKHYIEALRIRPNDAKTHNNLGSALTDQGKLSEAIKHYIEALRIRPNYVLAHYNLGSALTDQGRISEAIKHYTEALRIRPDFAETRGNLKKLSAILNKIDEAVKILQELVKVNPEDPRLHYDLGTLYYKKGEFDKAIYQYQKSLSIRPDNPSTYYNIACMYSMQNRVEKSIDFLKKAIEKGYDNWDHIRNNRDLENVRGSSQYKKLVSGS